ncbi:MAG TPA: tetratricopeptide repeat protein [Pyrinomonadaceae bacterium]|nr:tetratricopeptide repeat protein [Pyrinomonadaceae bacterium]
MTRHKQEHRTAPALAASLLLALLLAACGGGDSSPNANNANAASSPAVSSDAEIAELSQQAERSPGDEDTLVELSKAYYRRGESRRAAGQLREALADYRSAIRAFPDNEDAKQRVAEISPQFEGETTDEYGAPAPLPITPNVTTGDEGNTEQDAARATPTPTPTKKP